MMKLCCCDKAGGCCKIYIYIYIFLFGGGGYQIGHCKQFLKLTLQPLAFVSPLWFRWCCIAQLKHSTRIALRTSKPAQQITQNIQGLKLDRNISALTKKSNTMIKCSAYSGKKAYMNESVPCFATTIVKYKKYKLHQMIFAPNWSEITWDIAIKNFHWGVFSWWQYKILCIKFFFGKINFWTNLYTVNFPLTDNQ